MGFLNRLPARQDGYYNRNRMWKNKGSDTAANRRTLVSPSHMLVNIGGAGAHAYELAAALDMDLNESWVWDTQTPDDYTVAANRAGKDFYIYAVLPGSGFSPILILSAATTYPAGYSAADSRKIGGFHCECVDVGTITDHPLTGYLAGDIIPRSCWDLSHRSAGAQVGMVWAGKTDFDSLAGPQIWVALYLASGTGSNTASVYGGTISDTRDWMSFVDDFAAIGCRMMEDDEFQAIAAGSNEETNIAGSADPVTTGGHLDTASRRMVSNIGCEDCCGAMWQWLRTQSYRTDFDGSVAAASKTATITHAASPGGNPIYLKMLADGSPYLCCNMATDAADKWVSFGSNTLSVLIKHDADAATSGTQVYFDEDATQSGRLLANMARGKNCYVQAYPNTNYQLQVTHRATASSLGVAVTYDDASDERLEFTSPTAANGALDLVLGVIAFAYDNLPGAKGSLYKQGTYGDVKLLGGGVWTYATDAGSRARTAFYYRWDARSASGSRFVAESL